MEQEYKGHLSVVEQKQKEQQALESSIAATERQIEGLRKKSEESRQVLSHCRALQTVLHESACMAAADGRQWRCRQHQSWRAESQTLRLSSQP